MPSSGMLRCVALVRTDVSEESRASIIRVTRIGELLHRRGILFLEHSINVPKLSFIHLLVSTLEQDYLCKI
jgi:hypothetical protein